MAEKWKNDGYFLRFFGGVGRSNRTVLGEQRAESDLVGHPDVLVQPRCAGKEQAAP